MALYVMLLVLLVALLRYINGRVGLDSIDAYRNLIQDLVQIMCYGRMHGCGSAIYAERLFFTLFFESACLFSFNFLGVQVRGWP